MNVLTWWRCIFVVSTASFAATFLAVHMTTSSKPPVSPSPPPTEHVSLARSVDPAVAVFNDSYNVVFNTVDALQGAAKLLTSDKVNLNYNSSTVNAQQQVERERLLSDGCRRLAPKQWTAADLKPMTDSLFVDDSLRCIYCLVPKVACTTWTRVLFVASGKVKETNPNSIPQHEINWHRFRGKKLRPLSWYKDDEIAYRLQHYFKFMFVRHPIDRLVSAYRDRILEGEHSNPKKSITMEILSKLLNAQQFANRMRNRKIVTFKEFISYIVDPTNRPELANPHWRPQYNICHPCHIQYDFIGHFETLKKDANEVLQRIGAAGRVKFPDFDPDNQHQYTTADLKRNLFRKITASDAELLKTNVYRTDLELFGYT